jgi:hypothetical protein
MGVILAETLDKAKIAAKKVTVRSHPYSWQKNVFSCASNKYIW